MKVKVGVSNRHVHLCKEDFDILFFGEEFYSIKDLSQKGEFMSNLKVTIKTEKGIIEGVRVVGPLRSKTQVEISRTDAYKLGLDAPIRLSGDLDGTCDIMLSSSLGEVNAKNSCIIAKRHLHVGSEEAIKLGLDNGMTMQARIDNERGGILFNIPVRVKDNYTLELHLDTDEANALNLKNGDIVDIEEEFYGQE